MTLTLTAYQFFCFLGFIAIGLLLMVLGLIIVGRGEPKSVFGGGRAAGDSRSNGLAQAHGITPTTFPPPRDACMEDIKRRMSISN